MKRIYVTPSAERVLTQLEDTLLASASKAEYAIGADDSKYPEEGPIEEDWGDGPGVSGAKQMNMWE